MSIHFYESFHKSTGSFLTQHIVNSLGAKDGVVYLDISQRWPKHGLRAEACPSLLYIGVKTPRELKDLLQLLHREAPQHRYAVYLEHIEDLRPMTLPTASSIAAYKESLRGALEAAELFPNMDFYITASRSRESQLPKIARMDSVHYTLLRDWSEDLVSLQAKEGPL